MIAKMILRLHQITNRNRLVLVYTINKLIYFGPKQAVMGNFLKLYRVTQKTSLMDRKGGKNIPNHIILKQQIRCHILILNFCP